MKIVDAVLLILTEAGEPLHYREITKRMLDQGLWKTNGKTPETAVNASLSTHIKTQGAASRIHRLGPGMFTLNNHHNVEETPEIEPKAELPNLESESSQLSFTEAAVQILERFGHREPMHYRAITQKALELGLLTTQGKTPEATMYAQIHSEIERQMRRGERPRFAKHGNGWFGLTRWMDDGLAFKIEHHNAEIRRQLLNRIHSTEPAEFEELVGRLLTAMGFDAVVATPLSGDGGIDVRGRLVVGDVIRIKMAVQVKRWHNNVQAPVVQQVRGSLGAHEQGLIVTTSDFSKGAKAEAERSDATPVALMNGEQLVHLLVEHKIGVRRTPYYLIELGEEEDAE